MNNPDCDVALATNYEVPAEFVELFARNGIIVFNVPFDDYRVPDSFKWEYAFYKLKVLDYMANETRYDFILGVDTDTYFSGNLESLWEECSFGYPILYQLPLELKYRKEIIDDYEKLYGKREPIIQYGGDFLAGSRKALRSLSANIKRVYKDIQSKDFCINQDSGDEAILSMATFCMKVLNAAPFMRRYWTRRAFYTADPTWNLVPIWHLPAEKNYGLLKMYEKMKRTNSLPSKAKAARQFNLPTQHKYSFYMLMYYFYSILHR